MDGGIEVRVRKRVASRVCLVLALSLFLVSGQAAGGERLDRILDTEVLLVGTPGDYRPFSMYDADACKYEGHDIDLAELLARELGVKVEFVPTTWADLMQDYSDGKFDIAVGGITRSLARMLKGDFLPPYAPNGKVAIIHKKNKDRFTSLEAMDVPETTVIVNPGGTNEKYVNENFKRAKVVTHGNNAEIPGMIAEEKGDVMISEVYEAVVYSRKDDRIYGAFTDKPLTKISFMGFFIQQDDPEFLKIMNYLWNDAKLRGDLGVLEEKWLK